MPEILPTPAHHVPSEYFTRGCTGTGPPSPAINSTNSDQLPWQSFEVLKSGITSQNPSSKSYHFQFKQANNSISQTAFERARYYFRNVLQKKSRMWDKLVNYFKKIVGSRFPRHFDGGLSSTMTCHDPQGAGKIWHLFVIQRQTTQLFLVRPCRWTLNFSCQWMQTFWKMKDRTIRWKGKDLSHIPEQIKQDH